MLKSSIACWLHILMMMMKVVQGGIMFQWRITMWLYIFRMKMVMCEISIRLCSMSIPMSSIVMMVVMLLCFCNLFEIEDIPNEFHMSKFTFLIVGPHEHNLENGVDYFLRVHLVLMFFHQFFVGIHDIIAINN
jgi:hypothetical protein